MVTNDDLAAIVETDDAWIVSRTGIASRRIATEESATDLAADAGGRALAHAGVRADQIDLLVCMTITPDAVIPSEACLVKARLGLTHAVVRQRERSGNVSVFGLGRRRARTEPIDPCIRMQGQRVFKFASSSMASAIEEVVARGGMALDDVDLIVAHQANERIIRYAAKKIDKPLDLFPDIHCERGEYERLERAHGSVRRMELGARVAGRQGRARRFRRRVDRRRRFVRGLIFRGGARAPAFTSCASAAPLGGPSRFREDFRALPGSSRGFPRL